MRVCICVCVCVCLNKQFSKAPTHAHTSNDRGVCCVAVCVCVRVCVCIHACNMHTHTSIHTHKHARTCIHRAILCVVTDYYQLTVTTYKALLHVHAAVVCVSAFARVCA
jgi:hypothetical protein